MDAITADVSRVLVLGHRGWSGIRHPENSVAAVSAALDGGADGVEIDVRLTADGVLLCSHDPEVAAPAGERLTVATSRAADLRRIALPGGHVVATCEEVLAAAADHGRFRVVIEAKPAPGVSYRRRTARALRELVTDFASGLDLTVSSFDPTLLAAIREALVQLPVRTALLGSASTSVSTLLRRAVYQGHDEIHPNLLSVLNAPESVHVAHSLGIAVTCWTVNDEHDVRRLAPLGLDAMIADNPVEVRAQLSDVQDRIAPSSAAIRPSGQGCSPWLRSPAQIRALPGDEKNGPIQERYSGGAPCPQLAMDRDARAPIG
jgi:glycerophosphoryl diester phosphodiesterase